MFYIINEAHKQYSLLDTILNYIFVARGFQILMKFPMCPAGVSTAVPPLASALMEDPRALRLEFLGGSLKDLLIKLLIL